ncbi:MAG TPA: DUF5327 family protein [Metalysinibacillus sp.]
MISQQSVIHEMEKQLQQAKQAQSEAELKASLTAIQALCNVALHDTAHTKPTLLGQAITAPAVAQPKLEEDDANGDSLFDF